MTITAEQVYLLNKMNNVASKVQLGTLIQNAETILAAEVPLANTHILVGNASGVAVDVAMSGDATLANTGVLTIAALAVSAGKLAADSVITAKILDANVTKAKLAATVRPAYMVVLAGTFTTAGGDANETITATGALNTDLAFVTLKAKGGTPRTILTAAANTDAIDVVMSGDPSTDHAICWQVLRATT